MDAQMDHALHGQVVYVEDDPVSVALIRAIAERHYPGVSFRFASTVAQGLQLVLELPPDLLLLDMHLPDGSAAEMIDRVHDAHLSRRVRISLLTGETGGTELAAALRLGDIGYLSKPLRLAALHSMLCDALAEIDCDS